MANDTVTWLHLSDFHFTEDKKPGDRFRRNVILDKLVDDIASQVKGSDKKAPLKPDFIIITGDIAFSGKNNEYAMAEKFFDRLLAVTGLGKDTLLVVPGNHDVDRDEFDPAYFEYLEKDREYFTDYYEQESKKSHMFKKFKAYEIFINRYFEGLINFSLHKSHFFRKLSVRGRAVSIIGLNSAWMCGSLSADNSHHLYIGAPPLADALKNMDVESHVKIAAFHHPLDEYQHEEKAALKERMSSCDYILTGHAHSMSIDKFTSPYGELFFITSGSCYDSKKYSDAYNFVQLDYQNNIGRAHLRTRPNNKENWIPDSITYQKLEDGIYEWKLEQNEMLVVPGPAITTVSSSPLPPKLTYMPQLPVGWVGREKELDNISRYYKQGIRVVSLRGMGGVGKSSLARQWYEQLNNKDIQPDGVLWWSFYYDKSLENFFNIALDYVSRGKCSREDIKGLEAKKDKLVEYLNKGNFIFFLDGLEDIQKAEATEQYGVIENRTMSGFLELWAADKVPGFCLITTRYPMPDLMTYKNFMVESIGDLSKSDSRMLLEKAGVKGKDANFEKIYKNIGGHTLSLSLLAEAILKYEGGSAENAANMQFLNLEKNRVVAILRTYYEKLPKTHIQFMQILSCFLAPVDHYDFNDVFLVAIDSVNRELAALSKDALNQIVEYLKGMLLISEDKGTYTTHPLVREYFQGTLNIEDKKIIYARLYEYMDTVSNRTVPKNPKFVKQMTPLFYQVAYGCRAGEYDKTFHDIFLEKVNHKDEGYLIHKLGANATHLALLRNFFPDEDFTKMPLVDNAMTKGFIINGAAFSMKALGQFDEAEEMFKQGITIALSLDGFKQASTACNNLADLQIHAGRLLEAEGTVERSNDYAVKSNKEEALISSIAFSAYIAFLLGNTAIAYRYFEKANGLIAERESDTNFLYNKAGQWYIEYLLRTGRPDKALEVGLKNLKICEKNGWIDAICGNHTSLAAIYRLTNKNTNARNSIQAAITIAKPSDRLDIKLEIHLEQSRIEIAEHNFTEAEKILMVALDLSVRFGYRLFEADARNLLSKIYKEGDRIGDATIEAEKALAIATDAGYYWAKKDAEEFLGLPVTPPPL